MNSSFKRNVHRSSRLSRFPAIYNDVDFNIFVQFLDLKIDGGIVDSWMF